MVDPKQSDQPLAVARVAVSTAETATTLAVLAQCLRSHGRHDEHAAVSERLLAAHAVGSLHVRFWPLAGFPPAGFNSKATWSGI